MLFADMGLIKAVAALFIIIDPIGNVPIFITLTQKTTLRERRKIFHMATVVSLILLIVFALVGEQILIIFGISLDSFLIAGGILLLVLSIKILVFGERRHLIHTDEIGAVPMACPLLVGPGTIATTIVLLQSVGIVTTILSVLINFLIIWLVLKFIEPIHKFLGKMGASVIARVMAIFITAIGVGYITEGIMRIFY